MNWTTPADLCAQVQKLWDKGLLLACLAGAEPLFPRRLMLKGPTSAELAENFAEVRRWIAGLTREAKRYRLVWRKVNHRILGLNDVPAEAWLDTLEDALGLIGKGRDAECFTAQVASTGNRRPEVLPWLKRRPLRALALADDWPHLLDIVSWLQCHPRPGVYLRQVDIAGVHSKFIEGHRAVLAELFDLALPPAAIEAAASGAAGFCRRYGFRDKPRRLRFRLLDPDTALFPAGTDQDVTVNHETFARLDLAVDRVFITENEINFLAFPCLARSMVIFGAGYGFDKLAEAAWLHGREIYYWGDIDTHGFAILDQLRVYFPQTASFLMDRATWLAHKPFWGEEPQPERRELTRLTSAESALYDDLRDNRLGRQLRLEQERIGFDWVEKALETLDDG
ncbi:MAG: Wadjet anti-phage system protein JetD domain-containing protein [Desulfobacterales bacterium]